MSETVVGKVVFGPPVQPIAMTNGLGGHARLYRGEDYDALLAERDRLRQTLLDALFYAELVAGVYGEGVTQAERGVAAKFLERVRGLYPNDPAIATRTAPHVGARQDE